MAPRKIRIRSCNDHRGMALHWTADPRDVAGVVYSLNGTSQLSEVGATRYAPRWRSHARNCRVLTYSCSPAYRAHQQGSFAMQLLNEDSGYRWGLRLHEKSNDRHGICRLAEKTHRVLQDLVRTNHIVRRAESRGIPVADKPTGSCDIRIRNRSS